MSLFLKGILIGLIFGVPVCFSWFDIAGGGVGKNGWLVVLGVFIGTYFWWGGLTAVVAFAGKKKRTESFRKMNRIFWAALSLFGILVFIRAISI